MLWLLSRLVLADTEPEPVILEVELNQQSRGQHFLFLDNEEQIYLQAENLRALGFKALIWKPWQDTPHPFALSRLAPRLRYRFDPEHSRLILTVNPQDLEPRHIRVRPQALPPARERIAAAPLSGFFNYQLQTHYDDDGLRWTLPWEININYKNWTLFSDFLWDHPAHESRRGFSWLNWDRPQRAQRLRFGDLFSTTQTLDGDTLFTGVALYSDYGLRPGFSTLPEARLSYLAERPTTAELWRDGELLDSWLLPPGETLFSDFFSSSGQAEFLLRVQDQLGRQQDIRRAFFLNRDLLKTGLHHYRYQLGRARRHFMRDDEHYAALQLSGEHRYGVNPQLTVGLGFAATRKARYLAPQWDWAYRGRIFNQQRLEWLRRDGQNAYAAFWQSQWPWRYGHLSLAVAAYSRAYSRLLDTAASAQSPRTLLQLGLVVPLQNWGNWSLRYEQNRYWELADASRHFSLSYQNSWGDWNCLLSLRLRRGGGLPDSREALLTFNYALGKDWRLNTSSQRVEQHMRHKLSLSRSPRRGLSHGYWLSLEQDAQGRHGADARWQARWQRGVLDSRYHYQADAQRWDVSWAGGVAWLPGQGLHLSRPIQDSFALVSLGEPDMPLQLGEQVAGFSDAQGQVLVAELSAFYDNRLKIDLEALPMNLSLAEPLRYVRPRYRSGAQVAFEIQRFSAVEAYLYARADGRPLEQQSFQLQGQQRHLESFTGKAGYLYLENLGAGVYRGSVPLARGRCEFDLEIAASEDIVQNLGKLWCE